MIISFAKIAPNPALLMLCYIQNKAAFTVEMWVEVISSKFIFTLGVKKYLPAVVVETSPEHVNISLCSKTIVFRSLVARANSYVYPTSSPRATCNTMSILKLFNEEDKFDKFYLKVAHHIKFCYGCSILRETATYSYFWLQFQSSKVR